MPVNIDILAPSPRMLQVFKLWIVSSMSAQSLCFNNVLHIQCIVY